MKRALCFLLFALWAAGCEPAGKTAINPSVARQYEGKTLGAWIALLAEADGASRLTAIRVLGSIGPDAKAAVPMLAECLKDRALRVAASFTLGEMGAEAKSAVPALVEALRDDNDDVRVSAAAALSRVGPAATPELIRAVQTPGGASRADRPWFDRLVEEQPTIVAVGLVIVALAAIAASVLLAVLWIRHRERLARIEKGLDPDAAPESRQAVQSTRS